MTLRRLAAATLLCSATFLTPAWADTLNITFLLTNDIYKVDTTPPRAAASPCSMPWSRRSAPRGGHVIYAHAGDLISPSLMSGFDQGEHNHRAHQQWRTRHLHARQPRV